MARPGGLFGGSVRESAVDSQKIRDLHVLPAGWRNRRCSRRCSKGRR